MARLFLFSLSKHWRFARPPSVIACGPAEKSLEPLIVCRGDDSPSLWIALSITAPRDGRGKCGIMEVYHEGAKGTKWGRQGHCAAALTAKVIRPRLVAVRRRMRVRAMDKRKGGHYVRPFVI